jgi:hypothetical protein
MLYFGGFRAKTAVYFSTKGLAKTRRGIDEGNALHLTGHPDTLKKLYPWGLKRSFVAETRSRQTSPWKQSWIPTNRPPRPHENYRTRP